MNQEQLANKLNEFYEFPEEIRLRAEIAQLHKRFSRIRKLCQSTIDEFIESSPEIRDLKASIFNEAELLAVDLDEAIEYCKLNGNA